MKVEKVVLDNFSKSEGTKKAEQGGSSFADTLKESIDKVGQLEKEANQQTETLVKGQGQDVHNTMIAIEKADLSFQLMMQIRNKIINAYEEIMRLQV